MVAEVLLAAEEPLAVRRREEEAAPFFVAEELDGEEREPARLLEPAQLTCRHVQLVKAVRDVGVVVEHAGVTRSAPTPRALQATVAVREGAQQEFRAGPGGGDEIAAFEPPSRLGERSHRQPVPGSNGLVVAQRLRSLLALGEQPCPRLLVEVAAQDEAAALEWPQQLGRYLVLLGPRVREPFHAGGVG